MQGIITAIVVCAAVVYTVWRIYLTVCRVNDPCYGCKGCTLRDAMRKNKVTHTKECPLSEKNVKLFCG